MKPWTDKQTKLLVRLYRNHSYRYCAKKLRRTVAQVKAKTSNMGLKHDTDYRRMSQSIVAISKKTRTFILKNYLKYTNHELAKMAGCAESTIQKIRKEFGITGKVNTGCFKKGSVPANKGKKMPPGYCTPGMKRTQFKKGQPPKNTKYNGYISVRHNYKRGRDYCYKRIGSNKWREYHRILWEEKHGPIPKGSNVQFKDGNQLNCTIENLYLIKRSDQMNQNTIHRYEPELKSAMIMVGKLKSKIRKYEKQD